MNLQHQVFIAILFGTVILSRQFLFGLALRIISRLAPDFFIFFSIWYICSIFYNFISKSRSYYLRLDTSSSIVMRLSSYSIIALLSCTPISDSSSSSSSSSYWETSGRTIPSLKSVARVSIDFLRLFTVFRAKDFISMTLCSV